MTTIEESILIEAAPEQVGAYVEVPTNLLEIWPSMVGISDVQELPDGGYRYHWKYKMAGMPFEGDSETVEYEANRHFRVENTGQIPSTFDWTLMPEDGATRVVMKAEYEIPGKALGKLAKPFLVKLNEREARTVLENLKDRVEA